MPVSFIVTINNQTIYTCNKEPLPGRLRRYLDEMDRGMENGVQLGDEWVDTPSDFQKQQYIAMHLINALDKKDNDQARTLAFYLSNRYGALTEINVIQQDDLFNLKLITE